MRSLLLLALLAASAARAVPADTTAPRPGIEVGVSPILGAFYSPTRGFGAGAEATFRNVAFTGSEVGVAVEAMQRYGRYAVRAFTANPYEAPLYGGVGVTYVGTSVFQYYGLGPRTREEDRVELGYRRIEAEARLGWHPLGSTRLTVQPVVRLMHDHAHRFAPGEPEALDRLDAASRENLLRSTGPAITSVTYGVEAVLDGLDAIELPRFGTLAQGSLRRHEGLGGDPFRAWMGTASVYGYHTIGPGVVMARAAAAFTCETSERPVPFFLLPLLDNDFLGGFPRYRMRGRDALALSAGYRLPVLEALGYGAVGQVTVHAANAYDDLFGQFEPGIAFEALAREGERAPLRPALSVGGYLVKLSEQSVFVSGQATVSPEGLELATLRFLFDLRSYRPVLR